jgi:hypothetical protein
MKMREDSSKEQEYSTQEQQDYLGFNTLALPLFMIFIDEWLGSYTSSYTNGWMNEMIVIQFTFS